MFRIAYEPPDLTGVPEVIADLVRECLAKDPADRPAVDEIARRTRRAPAGAWLPGDLLARLDRAAAQPVPEAPRRDAGETGAPGLTGFPDFPEPVERDRPRDLLDMPEAGIAPPRVRETTARPGSRLGLWAGVALVLMLVALGSGLTLEAATAIRDALTDGGTEPAADASAPVPELAGPWRLTLGAYEPLFTVRLDLVEDASPNATGATVLAATRDAICTGRAKVRSRTDTTLTLGDFDVRRIGPGAGEASSRCGLPITMRLVSNAEEGPAWRQSPTTSVMLEPAGQRGRRVPEALQGEWYADPEGLRVTILPGRAGSLAVRGVEDRDGRHCEWVAALTDVLPNRISTTGTQVVEAESDPGCRSGDAAYDYTLASGRLLGRSTSQGDVRPLRRHH
jgi:hypothetical protein